jgi:cytochrome P450
MDPPQHTKIRNIVQAVFTPKMIRQKEGRNPRHRDGAYR